MSDQHTEDVNGRRITHGRTDATDYIIWRSHFDVGGWPGKPWGQKQRERDTHVRAVVQNGDLYEIPVADYMKWLARHEPNETLDASEKVYGNRSLLHYPSGKDVVRA